jgi:hypothetical protein
MLSWRSKVVRHHQNRGKLGTCSYTIQMQLAAFTTLTEGSERLTIVRLGNVRAYGRYWREPPS